MSFDLHIESVRSVYRFPREADCDDGRARLDGTLRALVQDELEVACRKLSAELGMPADAEVLVDAVSVRVRIAALDWDDAAFAKAWATGVASALFQKVRPLVARGGGVGDGAAFFADRFAAECAYLLDRFTGARSAWWWPVLFHKAGRVPLPAELIAEWIERVPEQVPLAVAALARAAPEGFAWEVTDGDARALVLELMSVRERRLALLARAAPGVTERSAEAPKSDRTVDDREGDRTFSVDDAEHLVFREIPAGEREIVARASHAGARLLLAVCFLLRRHPAAPLGLADSKLIVRSNRREPPRSERPARPSSVHRGRDDRDPRLAVADGGASVDPARPWSHESHRAAGPVELVVDDGPNTPRSGEESLVIVEAGDPDASPKPRSSATAMTPTAEAGGTVEIATRCAGLLFLIRRVAASSWLDGGQRAALGSRLSALGQVALHGMTAPLPDAARRAALQGERVLLEVFSGACDVDPEASPPDDRAREANAWLLDVAATIPRDLPLCDDGRVRLFGPTAADPYPDSGPLRQVWRLLLRPGRLRVSDTRADLTLSSRSLDMTVRMGGWDIDPGFVPFLGRIVRFHYEER